jgi:HSP20 family molecular chaperone IbpA
MVTLSRSEQAKKPRLVAFDRVSDRLKSFRAAVARRAYEIFQARGQADGHDIDDWSYAEDELFHSAHLNIAESDGVLMVRAEVPGFRPNELEVAIEPRRLFITGERVTKFHPVNQRTVYCDRCADRIFRVVGLPIEVDPDHATVELREGILELLIPTSFLAERKRDSIVRASDYRNWRAPLRLALERRG